MFRCIFVLTFSCTVIGGVVSALAEEPEKSEFVGYSRQAESVMERWLSAVQKLDAYSDEATSGMKSGFGFGGNDQKIAFALQRPKRFRLTIPTHEIVADGKEITFYQKNSRRYVVEPMDEDVWGQIQRQGVIFVQAPFSIAEFMVSKDPRSILVNRFHNLKVKGDETVDDDKCTALEGSLMGYSMNGGGGNESKVTLFLREKDSMLRRVEVEPLPSKEEEDEEDAGTMFFSRAMQSMKTVYDVKNIKIEQHVDKARFEFKPPNSAKKVDKFYRSWGSDGNAAQRFRLSGQPAPDFELDTTDGKTISLEKQKNKVVVLHFLQQEFGGRMGRRMGRRFGGVAPPQPSFDKLDQVRRDFADKDVTILCIQPGDSADDLLEDMRENKQELTVVLDPNREASSEYLEERWGTAIVLIGKDGVVQGKYNPWLNDGQVSSLKTDIEKLLGGEALASAKPMTEEELREEEEQRSYAFFGETADPIDEDALEESWSVLAQDDRAFNFGRSSGGSVRPSLWIRARDMMQEIDAKGKVVSELPIPRSGGSSDFGQDEILVGRMRGGRVVIHMTTIASEEGTPFGWRPPRAALITAGDESGEELWSFEVEAKQGQTPQHFSLADVDGRGGDELLFVHQGSVWIVNERGETIVRRQLPGMASWMRVDDLDRDQRAEVYVRTQGKLQRFDFRGKK